MVILMQFLEKENWLLKTLAPLKVCFFPASIEPGGGAATSEGNIPAGQHASEPDVESAVRELSEQ